MSHSTRKTSHFLPKKEELEDSEPFVYRGKNEGDLFSPWWHRLRMYRRCWERALIDWEIFNRPSKGSTNGLSHFAIKAETENNVLDAQVLNGDLMPPYTGELARSAFQSFGFGRSRRLLLSYVMS